MATITIENPAVHETRKVDGQGRVYIGRAYVGKQVRVTIEVVETDEGDADDA